MAECFNERKAEKVNRKANTDWYESRWTNFDSGNVKSETESKLPHQDRSEQDRTRTGIGYDPKWI